MEIVFYRSKEKPNYYLIYKGGKNVNWERMLRILTNTGEHENSGYPKVDVEFGYIFKTECDQDFFDFLAEVVSTNHTEHPKYNGVSFKAWYEFKNYEPDKWLKEFKVYKNLKYEEFMKSTQIGMQTTLF